MSKLTAKLSDGREHEVASEWHAKEDGYVFLVLKPEPEKKLREWWVIEDTEWPNMHLFFNSHEEAMDHRIANKLHRSKPFLVREVEE